MRLSKSLTLKIAATALAVNGMAMAGEGAEPGIASLGWKDLFSSTIFSTMDDRFGCRATLAEGITEEMAADRLYAILKSGSPEPVINPSLPVRC